MVVIAPFDQRPMDAKYTEMLFEVLKMWWWWVTRMRVSFFWLESNKPRINRYFLRELLYMLMLHCEIRWGWWWWKIELKNCEIKWIKQQLLLFFFFSPCYMLFCLNIYHDFIPTFFWKLQTDMCIKHVRCKCSFMQFASSSVFPSFFRFPFLHFLCAFGKEEKKCAYLVCNAVVVAELAEKFMTTKNAKLLWCSFFTC